MSDYQPNPDNPALLWKYPDAFLRSIPSQTRYLYVGLSELFFGFGMLLVTGWFFHVHHSLVRRVGSYFREWYIFVRCVYHYPSSGAYVLLISIIDGSYMGNNLMSGTSVTNFTHCSIAWSYTPSKTPSKRKIHHWSTLFTRLSYFWNTFISWSTYLLFFYDTILLISLPGVKI